MTPELQAEFDQALVAATMPSWEWEDGDIVTHDMTWESGGGCDTCGYGDPGMELNVGVRRAYCPDGFVADLNLRRWITVYSSEIPDVWDKVMSG